jgi:hypothetical protein
VLSHRSLHYSGWWLGTAVAVTHAAVVPLRIARKPDHDPPELFRCQPKRTTDRRLSYAATLDPPVGFGDPLSAPEHHENRRRWISARSEISLPSRSAS